MITHTDHNVYKYGVAIHYTGGMIKGVGIEAGYVCIRVTDRSGSYMERTYVGAPGLWKKLL